MGIQIQLEKLRSLPPLISQKRIFWVAICELMWNLKFTQKILLSDYVFTIKFILSKKRWDIMPNRDITNIRWNYKITFIYVEILFKKIFDVIYNIFIKIFDVIYNIFIKFLMLYITFLLKNTKLPKSQFCPKKEWLLCQTKNNYTYNWYFVEKKYFVIYNTFWK